MPITPFLRGQAFDPETVEVISIAFRYACERLGLHDNNDPLNGLVAKRVIELAQTGERNPITLYMLAVRGLFIEDEQPP
jgi:hypothetical protein